MLLPNELLLAGSKLIVSDVFLLIGFDFESPIHEDVFIFLKEFMTNKSYPIK